MNGRLALCTVAARNYLAQTRVLAESVRRWHPDLRMRAAIVDADGSQSRPDSTAEPFDIVLPASLGGTAATSGVAVPAMDDLQVRACRAKPRLMEALLDTGFEAVLFLDPDVLVVADLGPLLELVRAHPIVLTPHVLQPPGGPDRFERELALLRAGTFNGGCVGVRRSPQAVAFLAWWRARLDAGCGHDVARGVYYDQRWLDLAPALFGAHVCRDPGCNVAYWNLPERPITLAGGEWRAAGAVLRFVHFSGFDWRSPEFVSRHRPGLCIDALGPGQALFREYAARCRRCGGDADPGLSVPVASVGAGTERLQDHRLLPGGP